VLDAFAAVVKALLYGALLSAAGTPLAAISLRSPALVGDRASRLMRRAALLTIALSVISSIVLFARLGGEFDTPTLGAVFSSGPGAALALQIAGAALLLTPVSEDTAGALWLSSGALVITASLAFNGHAAASSAGAGIVATIHATAIAWWIGSLWLLRHVCTSAPAEDIAAIVQRFSKHALLIIAALVVTGGGLIWTLVDFSKSPMMQSYEWMLVLKLAFVALALLIATYNKFRLTPWLGTHSSAATSLRLTIAVELGVIACVLIITAVLTTYFSPESSPEPTTDA
jgi:putative copper export protein